MATEKGATLQEQSGRKIEETTRGRNVFSLRAITQTLVSVELQTDMRSSRNRNSVSTRRVILKASITSVILLTIAFIITYSVLLTYISNRVPLMRRHDGSSSSDDKSKSGKRTRLTYRPFEVFGRERIFHVTKDTVVKWNIDEYFGVLLNKPDCFKESKVTILITSAPENSDRRKAIRDTWCKHSNFNLTSRPWQCVFLIGQNSQSSITDSIYHEISQHHDILLGSYIDSYRNLTIKIMHGLYWTDKDCPTNFVLKTDDDVYVNTQLLSKLVTECTRPSNTYLGHFVRSSKKLKVIRDPTNKWFISEEEYSSSHYPPYAVGMGYLLSLDVIRQMLQSSQYIKPFANEDAYIGVLADRLGVEPTITGRFTLTGYGLRECNYKYLVVIHHVAAEDQYKHLLINQEADKNCFYPDGEDHNDWT